MPLLRRANQGDQANNNSAGISTQKLRLRRVPTKQEIIQQNLVQVKHNIHKKQVAQEHYYNGDENKTGRSPLKRDNLRNRLGTTKTMVFTNKNQRPVQRNPVRNKHYNPNYNLKFNNRQFVKRFNTQNGQNFRGKHQAQRLAQRQSAQTRIMQIRMSGSSLANTGKSIKLIRNFVPQQQPQQNVSKIRLRRQPMRSQPTNYKVQVSQPSTSSASQRVLNPQLQAEIKAIQTKVQPLEIMPSAAAPQPAMKLGVTGMTLNDRFTGLM